MKRLSRYNDMQKMSAFTITLVRHGETDANKDRIIQGQQDTHLSARGVEQARLVGKRLQADNFTHVYSSDLKRAYKTCELILDENTSFKGQIIEDSRLRERKFGIYEGKLSQDFQRAARKHRKETGAQFVPLDGESLDELRERAISFWRSLYADIVNSDTQQLPNLTSSQPTEPSEQQAHSSQTEARGPPNGMTSQAEGAAGLCPNISLSPDPEFSRLSSVGSGRNSSFDEGDVTADVTVANVLVVSHGGLMQQLIAHLLEVTDCVLPAGKRFALQTPPNTIVTRFCVNLAEDEDDVTATCLCIHDADHLSSTHVTPLTRTGEV